jgi:hypothetical protein
VVNDGGVSALALLRRARTELDGTHRESSPAERRAVVVVLADRLGLLARHPDCPVAVGVLLHDWRDRLGSHVLVAEALDELELHPDLADQMLQRGIDELLDEAPARLAALDARRSVAPQP